MNEKRIVFSGIQPSGNLHLGNYVGAIRNWVSHQEKYYNIFCVVDLHAITIYQNPEVLRTKISEVAGLLIASGIDPKRSLLFVQSHVTAHTELAWILNCVTPVGWLERMTQYKDKSAKQESVGMGLLDYPVLQAADILLYQTHLVPVGEDQRQHIELTRNIASRFNYLYGETFRLPEGLIPEIGAKIMSLDDPLSKMSKSTNRPYHAVAILDDPDTIATAFRRTVTDSSQEIEFSERPEKAGVNNLLTIYLALSGQSQQEIEMHFAGKGYSDLKREVAERVIETFRPIRQRYEALMKDRDTIDNILLSGAEEARKLAAPTLSTVKESTGLSSAI